MAATNDQDQARSRKSPGPPATQNKATTVRGQKPLPRRRFQPTALTSGECVLTNRRKYAPRPAFYLPMRSCAPVDFTLKKTEFTSPDVVLHFGACLLATLQFLQPRFASSI